VQARLEDQAQCLLVTIGATPEGKKELVGLADGVRESAQSWRELLLDLKRRGLATGPQLAVGDGALGFWKALDEIWPNSRRNAAGCTSQKTLPRAPLTRTQPAAFGGIEYDKSQNHIP
jgi:transposase-like protein